MEKADVMQLFKVGQLAEMKTFEDGYRGAWFRCKIRKVMFKKNKIRLEYYDYDLEEIGWVKIYEVPPYVTRSRKSERELMLRPPYPPMYLKSEMPPVNSLTQECVVIDGTWKVGDLVDWFTDSCYWCAKVIKVFSDDKVEVELPMPPVGERKDEEEDGEKLIASFSDLRPSLDWSETKGWTVPTTADGRTSSGAELIFPSKQGIDLEVENAPASSPLNASSSPIMSVERDAERQSSDPDKRICMEPVQSSDPVDTPICMKPMQSSDPVDTPICVEPMRSSDPVDAPICKESMQSSDPVDTPICKEPVQSSDPVDTPICREPVQSSNPVDIPICKEPVQNENPVGIVICEERVQSENDVKMDDDLVESSNSISSLRVEESKAADEEDNVDIDYNSKTDLNIMHEDTLEAAILDLEELVNKVKWIKNILHTGQSPTNHAPSWKFT